MSSARGNSLLHNTGSGYELRRAGSTVEAADFGWGGTFFDANNDGKLDRLRSRRLRDDACLRSPPNPGDS